MSAGAPYNPLDKRNLADSIASALLKQPINSLSDCGTIVGAGVYAIYYVGNFKPYAPIVRINRDGAFSQPIYVGKAIPRGGRKGGFGADAAKSRALSARLRQHASSIEQVSNLDLDDFSFRSLVVDDIWIPLGENVLIEGFRPIWNLIVDGFGNKDPGNRRATQYRSPWDVLHPGREFADKLAAGNVSESEIVGRISKFLSGKLEPSGPVETGE